MNTQIVPVNHLRTRPDWLRLWLVPVRSGLKSAADSFLGCFCWVLLLGAFLNFFFECFY